MQPDAGGGVGRALRVRKPAVSLGLLGAILAVLLLAGCGGEADSSAEGQTGGAEETLEQTDDPAREEAGAASGEEPAGVTQDPEELLAPQGAVVTVRRVVDGDTIIVSPPVEGRTEVDLIGVDAPETADAGENDQPFGPAAANYVASQVEGRKVALEFDEVVEDDSGRLLAYVRLPGGTLFNRELIHQGYAQAVRSGPNAAHREELAAAQRDARDEGRGLWGLPPGQLCQLADRGNGIGGGCEDVPASQQQVPEPEDEAPVAGVPPLPPDGDYDCGHFASQEQAQRVFDAEPGDPHELDEEGNGIACEWLP